MNVGDAIDFEFSEPVDLSIQSDYSLEVWTWDLNYVGNNNALIFTSEISNKLKISEFSSTIGFEDLEFAPDSFKVLKNEFTDSRISISAKNIGARGFRMTGKGVDHENLNFVFPENESDNFTANPDHGSKLCFCVGATDWDNVRLEFDLKQTHSMFYIDEFGDDMTNVASSMRILADGNQIGEQFHPNTYKDDPFVTYTINLDNYAGTDFDLCFETKAFLSIINDPVSGSKGDNTYLDNIRIYTDVTVDVEELDLGQMQIYPNPNNGVFILDLPDNLPNKSSLFVIDVLGRTIYTGDLSAGNSHLNINLTNYPKGVYTVLLRAGTNTLTKRIIIE
jgi:hypothetical protein